MRNQQQYPIPLCFSKNCSCNRFAAFYMQRESFPKRPIETNIWHKEESIAQEKKILLIAIG